MYGKSKTLLLTLTLTSLLGLTFETFFPARIFANQNNTGAERPAAKQKPKTSAPNTSFGNIPVYFEENQGQFDKRVKYFARGTSGYSLFLTSTEAVYVLQEGSQKSEVLSDKSEEDVLRTQTQDSRSKTQDSLKATAVYMRLAGADGTSLSEGLEQLPHRTNYFRGNDESEWQTEIPNYRQVRLESVYPGIDAVWKGKPGGAVQYDFVVRPNADPAQIKWEIEGAESVEIDERGDLLIKTELGEIRQHKPFTYQDSETGIKQEIESGFKIQTARDSGLRTPDSFTVGFEIGRYDRSKPLTIDPTVNLSNLSFSTFLGSGSGEAGRGVAIDRDGNVYVVGITTSATFPTTPGSFDTSWGGGRDVFVAKLNPTGSALVYSTFIGGSSHEEGHDIAVDSSGNAYITGEAEAGYPMTSGAFDRTHNGGNDDVFVTKLNPTGSRLVYSTFVGGSDTDVAWGIVVDLFGYAYITGETKSGNYPKTLQTFDGTHNGHFDAFVTKLKPNGSGLEYSTFVGGNSRDHGFDITIDRFGNPLITGRTSSTDFPTTAGAYDRSIDESYTDAFVVKLNFEASALEYSTFLGGSSYDNGSGIAVDNAGNAFITGETLGNFPTTPGAFDRSHNGSYDVFVTKLNPVGTGIYYSTLIGGSREDYVTDILLDADGNAYITGWTNPAVLNGFPTTPNAFDPTHNYSGDAFLTKLNADGSALSYSTFIGGKANDEANGVAMDSDGYVYITGRSSAYGIVSGEYPTTPGAFQMLHRGGSDAFITKFGGALSSQTGARFDLDGDGRTDVGIFRPGAGEWWYLRSSDGDNSAFQFGTSSDKLVPADFTGDGRTDIAFWRPSSGEWFILRSEDSSFYAFPFGASGDIPAPGDFDGDGRADPAIFRPSNATWYYIRSSDGTSPAVQFGQNGDVPIVEDYDGDGTDDIAVYRPSVSEWFLQRSSAGFIGYSFGSPGSVKPAPADYTGDGAADIAFFNPNISPNVAPGADNWFVLRSEDSSFYAFPFGASGDIPVPGDYDGDGTADPAVYRPSNQSWFLQQTTKGFEQAQFGQSGDVPIPSAYTP